jgi:hypothetical protein
MADNTLDMNDVEARKANIEACEAAHPEGPERSKCLRDSATVKTDYTTLINPALYLLIFGILIGLGFWAVNKYAGRKPANATPAAK